jgi:hypothetical protein
VQCQRQHAGERVAKIGWAFPKFDEPESIEDAGAAGRAVSEYEVEGRFPCARPSFLHPLFLCFQLLGSGALSKLLAEVCSVVEANQVRPGFALTGWAYS